MEFHLHQKSKDRHNRTVDWALAHCLHLRPDSILAAMPEGTTTLAEPGTSDMSFKKKLPKNIDQAKSHLMWVLEHEEALNRGHAGTPEHIKKLATWPGTTDSKDETSNVAMATSA